MIRRTAVLVEDEPVAMAELKSLVAEIDWLETVSEAADGKTAVEAIDRHCPDVVFLDVQLPEMSGLEVLDRIKHSPAVVFTTAYDKYAVAAFEIEAIDYLVKPFGWERFRDTVDRLRRSLEHADAEPVAARARRVMEGGPLTRVLVRDAGRLVPVAMDQVQRLEAEGEYVAIHTADRRYLVRLPLSEFERRLDPERFVRIHRSHIVNLDHVKAMEPYDGARLEVQMRNGARILASRSRSKNLREIAI